MRHQDDPTQHDEPARDGDPDPTPERHAPPGRIRDRGAVRPRTDDGGLSVGRVAGVAGVARVVRAGEQDELGFHLGQPGRVPRHQEGVVLVGEVAGFVLASGVLEGPTQEVTLVGEVPVLVARGGTAVDGG